MSVDLLSEILLKIDGPLGILGSHAVKRVLGILIDLAAFHNYTPFIGMGLEVLLIMQSSLRWLA